MSQGKESKRHCKKRILLLAAILFLCTLTGCIPNNFTREEKQAFLREARKVASSYLSDRYKGAKIQELEPRTIEMDQGYELTEFAQGQFTWKRQTYDFVVNIETGEIYTSVYLEELEEQLMDKLLWELGINSEETVLDYCNIYYLKDAEKLNGYNFRNVFPQEESAEELLEKILWDTEAYHVAIHFQYKGDDLNIKMMEQEAPFPTLANVTICHIAKEYALHEEGYYSLLPILSEEMMKLSFSQDTASYTRYQVLEQDGFRVVYNACERTREQDTITESVITEEDISLTVTEESIRLDCTKDNYCMYLFTTDKKMIKKYLYVFPDRGKETRRGMWFSFEDGYIYADDLIASPYKINKSRSAGNIIYSSPQKK